MERFDLDTYSQVAPHIFITSWTSSNDIVLLDKHQIAGVLTLELTPKPEQTIQFMKDANIEFAQIQIDDLPSVDIRGFLDSGADFIDKFVRSNQNVLVHCMAGISRSASIVLYYLATESMDKGLSPEMAFDKSLLDMKQARPVNPNNGFRQQIIEMLHRYAGRKIDKQNYLNDETRGAISMTAPTQPTGGDCDLFVSKDGKTGNVICLTEADFDDQGNLKNFKDVNAVIMIGAEWCSFCKKMKPDFSEFSLAIKNMPVRAFYLNAVKQKAFLDKVNQNSSKYGWDAKGFPTVLAYNKGVYYGTYSDTDPSLFRTSKSLLDFAQGIGNVAINWE